MMENARWGRFRGRARARDQRNLTVAVVVAAVIDTGFQNWTGEQHDGGLHTFAGERAMLVRSVRARKLLEEEEKECRTREL